MIRLATLVVTSLPLDARGRSAIDQVMADWRFERGASDRAHRRFFCHARYLVACARVVGELLARAAWRSPSLGLAALSLVLLVEVYVAASL